MNTTTRIFRLTLTTAHPFQRILFRSLSRHTAASTGLVKPITVRTCVGLYPKLLANNPGLLPYPSNVPTEGIDLTIDYVDTSRDPKGPTEFAKTILAVPGAAGYYPHYDQLIGHFRGSNVRVIVPNFPDFSHTRANGVFWHSTQEKVAFLKDFLEQIGVNELDCAVSHSFGFHSLMGLFEDPGPIRVKSFAFLCPQSLYDMTSAQVQISKKLFFPFHHELWYRFLEFTKFYKIPQFPAKFSNINDVLLFLVPALDLQTVRELPRRVGLLASSQIPVAMMYGEREKFISPKSRMRLFQEFGIKPGELIHVDPKQDSVEVVSREQRKVKGYVIKGGGHFAYANYHQYTHRIIEDLLNYHRS